MIFAKYLLEHTNLRLYEIAEKMSDILAGYLRRILE